MSNDCDHTTAEAVPRGVAGGANITVLAVHPPSVAATRLRAVQYSDALAEGELNLNLWSFLREQDLGDWFGPSQLRRALVTFRALLRLPLIARHIRRAAVVIVQREVLPLGPPVIEMLAARWRPLVWDVDDAVWQSYVSPTAGRVPRWLRATGDKYRRICERADEVWAGSEVLATWCRRHSESVHVIPTVVPVPPALPDLAPARTVGWVGSHSTGEFVEAILPALVDVTPPPQVLVVGARPETPPGLDVVIEPWSHETEAHVLSAARVGIYPIDPDHPLAEGKCGLKAILFMSHGIPCVVTPTTTNAVVVRNGVDGLHARTPAEWTTAVQTLFDDDDLWQRCREAAHARARDSYSLEVWAPRVADRLRTLADRTDS
jgi:glycosyltransferase involved in cell wall biosynthesis